MTKELEYTVERDGEGWGVIWRDAFVNQEPLKTKNEAIALANECNAPGSPFYLYTE